MPQRRDVVKMLEEIRPEPKRKIRLSILQGHALPSALKKAISQNGEHPPENLYNVLIGMLDKNPDRIGTAEALLHMYFQLFRDPSLWLDKFRCPNLLADLWNYSLFLHYAGRGRWAEALPLW